MRAPVKGCRLKMHDSDSNFSSEVDEIKKSDSFSERDDFSEYIHNEEHSWNTNIKRFLQEENPFIDDSIEYEKSHRNLVDGINNFTEVKQDLKSLKKLSRRLSIKIDEAFLDEELENINNEAYNYEENKAIYRSLVHEKWRRLIDIGFSNWEMDTLSSYRESFLKRVLRRLNLINKIEKEVANSPVGPGLFFDYSRVEISISDENTIFRWLKYISEDETIRRLYDLLGRIGTPEEKELKDENKKKSTEKFTDPDLKEEIVGVHFGRDIELALPQELSLLSDSKISILFDLKYLENRITCFDKEGWLDQDVAHSEEMSSIKEELGPVIICVDTSASMRGAPEIISKAITLFLASRSIEQKRDCAIINFSTELEVLDLTTDSDNKLSKVASFLRKSFFGGTDVSLALWLTLNMMTQESFERSDVLVISDFIMGRLPNELIEEIDRLKKGNNKFYSLSIVKFNFFNESQDIFDEQWIYKSSDASISIKE